METNGCKKQPEQVRCIELPCESLYFGFIVFFQLSDVHNTQLCLRTTPLRPRPRVFEARDFCRRRQFSGSPFLSQCTAF